MAKVDRRTFVAGAASCGLGLVFARPGMGEEALRHVPWLSEIQRPPTKQSDGAPKPGELLVDAAGKPITTVKAWETKRRDLSDWWQSFLGEPLTGRERPPRWTVLEEDRVDGVSRQRIAYETEPGIATEAYLCQPERADRAPAVVVLHSTVDYSILQPAGLKGPVEKAFGLQLAKNGFVTLSPRNFLWPSNEGIAAQEEAKRFLERAPGRKGMRKMLHDAQVAVDLLERLPAVDKSRIGSVGHSLGAKEVLYLAAFDPRVKATVSSEGGIGVSFSNWEAPWYLGGEAKKESFGHDHHELLALCAPRPFLLMGGESADGDRGWPWIESAMPVYQLYDPQPAFGQWNHRQGHAVPPEAVERIVEWFKAYL